MSIGEEELTSDEGLEFEEGARCRDREMNQKARIII